LPASPENEERVGHPIATFALTLLTQEKGSAQFLLPPKGDLALRDRFTLHFIKEDLQEAAEELAILAWFLEEKRKSPQAAQKIRRILADASKVLVGVGIEMETLKAADRIEAESQASQNARNLFRKSAGPDERVGQEVDPSLRSELNAALSATRAARSTPAKPPAKPPRRG
jgi:hypothetical protein